MGPWSGGGKQKSPRPVEEEERGMGGEAEGAVRGTLCVSRGFRRWRKGPRARECKGPPGAEVDSQPTVLREHPTATRN